MIPTARLPAWARPAWAWQVCRARQVSWAVVLLVTVHAGAEAASTVEIHSTASERTRYSALCRAHKDIDSCSDAVRWSPGDPALIVALADALQHAGRLPEALRDYRRARQLDPELRGIDEKIKSVEAKTIQARANRKPSGDRVSADQATARHYSNVDPEARSH